MNNIINQNYSSALVIEINLGTLKASNLYIDINFPEDVIIMDENVEIEEPENPIPYTPMI